MGVGVTWQLEMLFLWGVSVKDFLCVPKRTVKDILSRDKRLLYRSTGVIQSEIGLLLFFCVCVCWFQSISLVCVLLKR